MAQETDNPDHSNLHGNINTDILKDYTNSLLSPRMPNTPQQTYGQAYPATPDWQTSTPGIFNFHAPLQNSVMATNNNFLNNQQDIAAYDDGDDFYGSDSKEENTQNKSQATVQGATMSGIHKTQNKSQNTTRSLMNSSGQTPVVVNSQDKPRAQAPGNSTPSGSQTKKDPAEYAAELRAKLLAKRGASTTPTPNANSSKANNIKIPESSRPIIKSPATTQKPTVEVKAPQHLNPNGVARSQPSGNSPIKDPTNSSAPIKSTDIEGLISEYRASEVTSPLKSNMTSQIKSNGKTEKNQIEKPVKNQASRKPLASNRRGNNHGRSPGSSESGEIVENPVETKEQSSMSDPHPKSNVDTSLPLKLVGSNPTSTKSKPSPLDVQRRPSASAGAELQSPSGPRKVDPIRDRSPPPHDMRRAALDRRSSKDNFHRRVQVPQESPNAQASDLPQPKPAYKKEFELRREQAERKRKEKEAQVVERKKPHAEPHSQSAEQQAITVRTKPNSETIAGNGPSKSHEPPTPTSRAQREDPIGPSNIALEQKPDPPGSTLSSQDLSRLAPLGVSREDNEDLGDWLEISGYFDLDYRKKALTRHRKVRALEAQKAALEHEAQIEFFEKVSSLRSKSAAPRENLEFTPSLYATNSLAVQPTSAKSMAPPSLSIKDDKDDVGIKIKNTANRDGLSTASRTNVAYHNTPSEPLVLPPLKRRYADTDQHDSSFDRASNKIARVNSWNERSHEKVPQISPVVSSVDDVAFESQRSNQRRAGTCELQTRSRSPVHHRRSASPHRRGFIPDYATRQNSWTDHGHSSNRYQPFSRSNAEKSRDSESTICQHCDRAGHQAIDCPYPRRDDRTKHPASAEGGPPFRPHDDRSSIRRESSYSGNYQHYDNASRGGARGARGGPYNIRGNYKASSYNPICSPAQARRSESLNLQAGGQSSCLSSSGRP